MEQTEKFIVKATAVHGDKYYYSKVVYVKNTDKIIIICNTHGQFEQTPKCHLRGGGCKLCGRQKCIDARRSNVDDFIKKSELKHVDENGVPIYGYKNVNYIKCKTHVLITCKKHGDFEQTPDQHLSGRGCCKCAGRMITTHTEFITKAREKHGDLYDYSKVVYIKSMIRVIITCVNCKNEFEMTPNKHISCGQGCKLCSRQKCSDAQRSNVNDFIKKSELKHVDENGVPIYGYKNVNYINCKTHVLITCKKHGDFKQQPNNHLSGYGCNECSNENSGNSQRLTTEQFIEKSKIIHGDKYDYSKVVYHNAITNVVIICVKCKNEFKQKPNSHLNGNNCPHCKNKTEQKLYDALKPLYPSLITQFKQEWCKKARYLPFDLCIPEDKIIIELDGIQHFRQVSNWNSPEETLENDLFKEKCANDNGYSVIRILQEDVFRDKYDWLSNVQTEIENIIKDNTIIHNIYMCKNGEYDKFIIE